MLPVQALRSQPAPAAWHPIPSSLVFMTPAPNDTGMQTRREVLGDGHVDRAIANTTEFTAPLQDLITSYARGEIWTRPG